MSYLHYFCLFDNSGVQHILCCGFFSCAPYVASFSGLPFFYSLFDILKRLFGASADFTLTRSVIFYIYEVVTCFRPKGELCV